MGKASTLAVSALSTLGALATPLGFGNSGAITFRGPFNVAYDSVHNIHVDFASDFEGDIKLVHGPCEIKQASDCHHEISNVYIKRDRRPERFVWVVPEDAVHEGCLHAYSNDVLVGRSGPITVSHPKHKRDEIAAVADTTGPWFDGVAALAASNKLDVFVSEAKSKSVGIVGGGMAGVLTALLLESVGVTNWHIIESSGRIGGRIRTKYLAGSKPDEYQYQEMGPMRFPVSVRYADTNETLDINDHKMVFQLADYLNTLNGNDSALAVKFIPWIQASANVPAASNGVRKPNGLIPSVADIRANSSLRAPAFNISTMDLVEHAHEAVEEFIDFTPERVSGVSDQDSTLSKLMISDRCAISP